MRKIEAIIRPSAFEDVQRALDRRGIGSLTVSEVFAFGKRPGDAGSYRGTTYPIDWHTRLRLEIIVSNTQAGPIAVVVAEAARTGQVGDGLVTLLPVEEAIRVRTPEPGDLAVGSHTAAEEGESPPQPAVRRAASGPSPS